MKTGNVMPLTQVFVSISDPRSARHTRHDLAELLTVAVCAVLLGVATLLTSSCGPRPSSSSSTKSTRKAEALVRQRSSDAYRWV
jgi:hypothetical protein